jgi:hypothetical protein
MKYYMDTHDKNTGSFPAQELTEEQFFENLPRSKRLPKSLMFSVMPRM